MPKFGFSLEARLMQRLTSLLALSFVLFTIIYLFVVPNDSAFHAVQEAGELAQDLGATIHDVPGVHSAFDRSAVERAASWPAGSAYAAIVQGTEEAVQGSAPSLVRRLLDHPADQLSGIQLFDTPDGMTVFVNERVYVDGTTYRIGVLRPMTAADIALLGLRHEFTEEILPCFVPAFLLALGVTWLTIRTNLRPLRRASEEARAVSIDNPGHRMSTDNLSTEIRPLIDAVNGALSHLESALSIQQRFTANAAHELRTPLAVLCARVDGMEDGPVRKALTRDIARISRAVSQMLLAARLQAHAKGETSIVDLAALIRDVVADLAPLAHAQSHDISLDIVSRPHIKGSATALESAARNLIDNALRFTPAGDTVVVTVGPGASITVDDSGPGIKDDDKEKIFEPFWRGTQQQSAGAGLGLAIVREAAALHEGTIAVEDSPRGGARFVLTFPHVLKDEPVPKRNRSIQPA